MKRQNHRQETIQQTVIEDLTINEEQAAEVQGGHTTAVNTYTGATRINSGLIII